MSNAELPCTSRPRFTYRAFALTIASEIPLIDLSAGYGAADVEVVIGAVLLESQPADLWTTNVSAREVHGWIPGTGAFSVSDGRIIVVDPVADADPRALRLSIVGPLLGAILAQRGNFVIHASTVVVEGAAIALCGPSGRGKSTLAAALVRRGYALIADDMTVIDLRTTAPYVQSGFPRIKLWPDSAAALEHDVEQLPLIHPERSKRSLQVAADFNSHAVPLARCYLLEDAAADSIVELSPTESILALVKHTYQSRFLHETGALGANLQQCAALTKGGVVRQMRRRRCFDTLPEVIRMIESDVRAPEC